MKMYRSRSTFVITILIVFVVISSLIVGFLSMRTPKNAAAKSLVSSPTSTPVSGTIYTATGSTIIATSTNGSNVWSNQNVSSCSYISGPVVDDKDGVIYMMDHLGSSCINGIYAVNAKTGQNINGANGSPPLLAVPNISSYQPTIDNTGSTVKIVVYTADNKMSSYTTGGTLLWSYQLNTTVTTTPIVANGNVYFGTADGHIEVLNDNTTNAQGDLVGSYALQTGFTITTDLIIYNQVLYFGTTQGGNANPNVFALNISANQPALKWNVQTPAPLTSFPNPYAGTTVYVGTKVDASGHGHLMALNADTGQPIRPDFLTGSDVTGAVIGGNDIYVASDGLYSITMSNGQQNWVVDQTSNFYELGATNDAVYIDRQSPTPDEDEALNATDGSIQHPFVGIASYAQRISFNQPTPPPPTRTKLFVFIQGFDTTLSSNAPPSNSFGEKNGIASYLTSNFNGSQFLMYSYNGDDGNGYPTSYQCQNTFTNHIGIYSIRLITQLSDYLKDKQHFDVYLIGHSFGGVIAYGYLSWLETQNAFQGVIPGTVDDKLAGVVTMDSPLGGIADDYAQAKQLVTKEYISLCPKLGKVQGKFALDDIFQLYNTGTLLPHGGFNSIPKVLYNENYTNEDIAVRASATGVLTIGNLLDYLYNPTACNIAPGLTDFRSTQWLKDEGNSSGIYGRDFSKGKQTCSGQQDLTVNHGLVFTDVPIQAAIGQLINGQPITALKAAPSGN